VCIYVHARARVLYGERLLLLVLISSSSRLLCKISIKTNAPVILHVMLYGREALSFIIKEERKLRMLRTTIERGNVSAMVKIT
jgi:hypothetical protein